MRQTTGRLWMAGLRALGRLVLIAALLAGLTGCWDRREINDLAVAMGLGIDKLDGKYRISVQVVNPTKVAMLESGGSGAPVVLYSSVGRTMFEAFRLLTEEVPRKVYFSHLQLLVIGQGLAEEGIRDVVDMISRNYEFRPSFYFAIADNASPEQILSIPSAIDPIPANEQRKSLEESERVWASTIKVTYDQLINDFSEPGNNSVLTGVAIHGRQISDYKEINRISLLSRLKYSQSAAFQGDRFVGWLSTSASKTYNYMHNHVQDTIGIVPCPGGGVYSLDVLKKPITTIHIVLQDDIPKVDVHIKMRGNISEMLCNAKFTRHGLKELERNAEESLIKVMDEGLEEVITVHKTDVLGIGRAVHAQYPEYWKKNKHRWDDIFPQINVNVTADISIRDFGETTERVKVY